eukprot:256640-Rhodomonas_salina.1
MPSLLRTWPHALGYRAMPRSVHDYVSCYKVCGTDAGVDDRARSTDAGVGASARSADADVCGHQERAAVQQLG